MKGTTEDVDSYMKTNISPLLNWLVTTLTILNEVWESSLNHLFMQNAAFNEADKCYGFWLYKSLFCWILGCDDLGASSIEQSAKNPQGLSSIAYIQEFEDCWWCVWLVDFKS